MNEVANDFAEVADGFPEVVNDNGEVANDGAEVADGFVEVGNADEFCVCVKRLILKNDTANSCSQNNSKSDQLTIFIYLFPQTLI